MSHRQRTRPRRALRDSSEIIADTGASIPLPDWELASAEDVGSCISTSSATFRAMCEERPETLPSISLDLRDEDLDELAPKARAAWERLQALFADEEV